MNVEIISSHQIGTLWKVVVKIADKLEVFRVFNLAELDREILKHESMKAAPIPLGPREVLPPDPPPPPPPPTQEELDLQAFLLLLRDYREKAAAFGTITAITQKNVDDAYAAMKAACENKPEYAKYLVGVF